MRAMSSSILRRAFFQVILAFGIFQASEGRGQYSLLTQPQKELFDACRSEMLAKRAEVGLPAIPIEEIPFAYGVAASGSQETTVAAAEGRLRYATDNPLLSCILRARIRQLNGTLTASASRPNIAAKPASPPKPANSTQQARPRLHSPQFSAQRADLLAGCSSEIQRSASADKISFAAANSIFERIYLDDNAMNDTAEKDRLQIKVEEKHMGSGLTAEKLYAARAVQCLNQQHLAKLEGKTKVGDKGTAVPALRPTITQQAHNPAGEATECLDVIYANQFDVEHVSSTQKAVFRNRCSRPVEVTWCTVGDDCRPGYSNLFTVPARNDRGFSYEPSIRGSRVEFAGCYNGFVPHQGELSRKLLHACK
jgi:hypothetical protein